MRRIVPNIYSNDIEKSKEFCTGFLGMDLAMDMDWILTFVSKENKTSQISIFQNDTNKPLQTFEHLMPVDW